MRRRCLVVMPTWNNMSLKDKTENKSIKKYYFKAFLLAFIVTPLIVSLGLFLALLLEGISSNLFLYGIPELLIPALLLALVWRTFGKRTSLPEENIKVLLPVFLAYAYYLVVWIVLFAISGFHINQSLFGEVFMVLTLPYFIMNTVLLLTRSLVWFPWLILVMMILSMGAMIIRIKATKKPQSFDKASKYLLAVTMIIVGIISYQHYCYLDQVLTDIGFESVNENLDYWEYHPFTHRGINPKLTKLKEEPTITINENYPRLDGATAAYPVYAAMVQELYQGLNEESVNDYIDCSTTNYAYQRLVDKEIDIFFGAQPSPSQWEMAKDKGLDFNLTPVAQEAFVFFVHKDNPIESLSVEEIQAIYQKKIRNWKKLGGNNEKILPFQRPEDSGSQTIMTAMVMKGKKLPPPLWEEYSDLMAGVVSQVAVYRNYSSAIGYSFRYFVEVMSPNNNIKILKVEGVEPSIENIRNGSYPFTIPVYAVTTGSDNENVELLLKWLLSTQGQTFIEDCGYISWEPINE